MPEQEAIDPYELIEAVEILSKLPKDFYENLVSTDNLGALCCISFFQKGMITQG